MSDTMKTELGPELRRLADKLGDRMEDLECGVRADLDEPFQVSIGGEWPPDYERLIGELEKIIASGRKISEVLSAMALDLDRAAFRQTYPQDVSEKRA